MAALPESIQFRAFSFHEKINSVPAFATAASLEFLNNSAATRSLAARKTRYFRNLSSCCSDRNVNYVSNAFKKNQGDCCGAGHEVAYDFKRWVQLAMSIFSGGSWWDLSDFERKRGGYSVGSKPTTVLKALSEMWALVADEKWILYTAFGALAVAAFSEVLMPSIMTAAVFSAQNGEMLAFFRNSRLLILLCFTSGICSGLRSGSFAIANTILVKRLRETLYSSLLLQDISFFDKESVGDLTSRITTDCQRLSRTVGHDVYLILRNIIQGIGALINLMTLSWPLSLSSLVICFILSGVFLIYGQYQKKAALIAQEFVASANEVAQETFSLIRTVRAYGTEREEFQRFTWWLDGLASVGLRESMAYGFWHLSFLLSYRFTQVFAVLLGGMSIMAGSVSAEQLTKYVLYCEWLIYATWRLQDSMSSLFQSIGACENVFQLMHLSPSSQFLSKGAKLQRLAGCIDFVNVNYHYSSRNKVPVLENVSFCIQANEVVAIVGSNGSGKSTLVNLLLCLYEPSGGEIFIDGIPLGEIDISWLREQIGVVGQEPHLFRLEVKSNITYGCSRSFETEDIVLAANNAYAHEFISALPRGYDTIIDDDLLSGGQKQRIAIARALLRDPAILLLDEATSALDSESEGYIQEILYSLKKDGQRRRTIIIIAHKLSTIIAADKILAMNEGRVVEVGTHQELLDKGGVYARFFKIQTGASYQEDEPVE